MAANATDDGFNGSVMTFASVTFGGLRSLEFTESAPKVNVTGSPDGNTTYRTGVPDPALTATFVGGLPASGAAVGTQGALAVTWQDTTSDGTITLAVIVDTGTSGSMDGEIISTITFATAQADT
jgi:hypothetical protein